MKVLCIYNPQAGAGKSAKHIDEIKGLFKTYGLVADFVLTEYEHHGLELAKNTDLKPYKGLIVAGGDGSFFDVLNGYMQNPDKGNTPLGVLPVGTGNSLSRDILNENSSLEDFVKLVAEENTKSFDIAKVKTKTETFYFSNMMGFGMITDISATAAKLKIFNKFAYTLGVLYNTIKLNSFDLQMIADGKEYNLDNVFVIVSNSKYTGGNYLIAPKAKINDGKLDLIILNKLSRYHLLETFPKIFDGSHIHTRFVDYIHAKEIKFVTKKAKTLAPDGEVYGELPAQVSCLSGAIQIFA